MPPKIPQTLHIDADGISAADDARRDASEKEENAANASAQRRRRSLAAYGGGFDAQRRVLLSSIAPPAPLEAIDYITIAMHFMPEYTSGTH